MDYYRELRRTLFNVGEMPSKDDGIATLPVEPAPSIVMPETSSPVNETPASPFENRYVELYRLTKAYPNPYGEDIAVVDGFNLIMKKGEVVSIGAALIATPAARSSSTKPGSSGA